MSSQVLLDSLDISRERVEETGKDRHIQKQIVSMTETILGRCRDRVLSGEKISEFAIANTMKARHGL